MNEFLKGIAESFSGENGPLYAAITAITGLTIVWKFFGSGYGAVFNGGSIQPQVSYHSAEAISSGTKTADPSAD